MLKKFVFIVLLLGFTGLFAQNKLEIPDSTIERGVIYDVPLYFNSDEIISKVSIKINFDWFLLDIKDIIISETSIADNVDDFKVRESDNQHYIEMTLNIGDNLNSDVLCYIRLEALVGSDSIAVLTPYELGINGSEANNYDLISGRMLIPGELIYPSEKESISLNYPNPFYYYTNFDFVITEKTNIEFDIYNNFGKLIARFPGYNEQMEILIHYYGQLIDIDDNEFEPGQYRLSLLPSNINLTSGVYYIIMQSNSNIYKRKFIYQK